MAKITLVDTSQDIEFRTFMTAPVTAARYGDKEKTLANNRSAGRGLPFYKQGRTVLYCMEECDQIILASRQKCGAA